MTVELLTTWRHIGNFELRGPDFQLKIPSEIPSVPGVYQILSLDAPDSLSQIYVGEAKNLLRRLNNYRNAGYNGVQPEATNRRVQGWIYRGLSNNSCKYEIHVCTEGVVIESTGERTGLDFSQTHTNAR